MKYLSYIDGHTDMYAYTLKYTYIVFKSTTATAMINKRKVFFYQVFKECCLQLILAMLNNYI